MFEVILIVRLVLCEVNSTGFSSLQWEPYITGRFQPSYTMPLTWVRQTLQDKTALANLGSEASPLRILQGNSSATLVPAVRSSGMCILPEAQHVCPFFQKIALTSSRLVLYSCHLLHSCGYLQYIQFSKYFSGIYTTDTKKETTMSSGPQRAMPGW